MHHRIYLINFCLSSIGSIYLFFEINNPNGTKCKNASFERDLQSQFYAHDDQLRITKYQLRWIISNIVFFGNVCKWHKLSRNQVPTWTLFYHLYYRTCLHSCYMTFRWTFDCLCGLRGFANSCKFNLSCTTWFVFSLNFCIKIYSFCILHFENNRLD